MLCGTHLQQNLAEEEQGFLVLCSTKETKPHYCYTHSKHVFSMTTQALGNAYGGNNAAEQLSLRCFESE